MTPPPAAAWRRPTRAVARPTRVEALITDDHHRLFINGSPFSSCGWPVAFIIVLTTRVTPLTGRESARRPPARGSRSCSAGEGVRASAYLAYTAPGRRSPPGGAIARLRSRAADPSHRAARDALPRLVPLASCRPTATRRSRTATLASSSSPALASVPARSSVRVASVGRPFEHAAGGVRGRRARRPLRPRRRRRARHGGAAVRSRSSGDDRARFDGVRAAQESRPSWNRQLDCAPLRPPEESSRSSRPLSPSSRSDAVTASRVPSCCATRPDSPTSRKRRSSRAASTACSGSSTTPGFSTPIPAS